MSTDFRIDFEAGIATLWMQLEGKANKINQRFGEGFAAVIEQVFALPGLTGIILTSGHKDFCVGADLDFIYRERDPGHLFGLVELLQAGLRRLETGGVPVVAAINGSALGGGYELALACHHRIMINSPKIQVGLPEVTLGVIPGGGGTQRLARLIGLESAMDYIAQGKLARAKKAKKVGLVDGLVQDQASLFNAAKAWIAENPKATQPWDVRGFKYPGGMQPDTPDARNLFTASSAMLIKKTAGAYKAPEAAIQAIYEGTLLGFDAGMRVEARYFAQCVISDQAKDMIRTFWYHQNAVKKLEGLPRLKDSQIRVVGILGAGMMGAGLATVSALRGYSVVIKDIDQAALSAAFAHCKARVTKLRHMSKDAQLAALSRIQLTLKDVDLARCDLIIEAVPEDKATKHGVIRQIEAVTQGNCVFASNTSALPITDLAEASIRPDKFLGLHFFSPVEKMPLVEVITTAQTSDKTLARALAFVGSIKKTPIVVNDGYGFYTSRLFSAYILEAVTLVHEGYDPAVVEWSARQAGMVVAPLKVFDEVTLSLGVHAFLSGSEYTGMTLENTPGMALAKRLADLGRAGKSAGAGFYDYTVEPHRLWGGLHRLIQGAQAETSVAYCAERLMLAQAVQAAQCLDEGILRHARDAEIGAIMGVGFAPNTGGPLAFLDRFGLPQAVERLDELAMEYGARYAPPEGMRRMAANGETYFEVV